MDLILARRAGAAPLDQDELEATLRRQPWLTHRPDDAFRPWGTFAFQGGGLYVVPGPFADTPYATPWLHVWLTRQHDYRTVAPRLVCLAGELGLGIDTIYPADRWWEVPAPRGLAPDVLERATNVSGNTEHSGAWLLMGFVLADPSCLELAESNPALALLVACTHWFRDTPETTTAERRAFFRDLAHRPRHEILERTEGVRSRSLVRLLARVVPERLDIEALRLLTREGVPPHLEKPLHHLRRLRCSLLELVADPRLSPHVGPRLLREAAEAEDYLTLYLLRDTLDMADHRGVPERVGVVPSRARLAEIHDALLDERQAQPPAAGHSQRSGGAPTPGHPAPPPPAGTFTILPLRTEEELRDEGTQMRHCVSAYGPRVARGECHVFRVLAPERATLSIRLARSGDRWEVEQLLGPRNQPVLAATERTVRAWLNAS